MKDLWDEMDLMVPGAGCDCEETRPFLDQFKNLRLLQFLVGLNESYNHVRSQILLKTPVLTVNQAYALSVQEESQRHLKENFYKIIGYPSDFKSKKKPQNTRVKGYANISVGEGGSSDTISQMQGHFFTEDQYKQLHILIQGLYSGKVLGFGKEYNGHHSTVAMQHIPLLKNKIDAKTQHSCESKCEVFVVLKDFFTMVQNQFGLIVKRLRSDNGTEFFSSKWKSPYEVLYKNPASIEHLKVFGCLCFGSTLPRGDKFAPRARRAVFIGFSETQKSYRLYDLENRTFLVSRDVLFREQLTPIEISSNPNTSQSHSPDIHVQAEDISPNITHTEPQGHLHEELGADSIDQLPPLNQEEADIIMNSDPLAADTVEEAEGISPEEDAVDVRKTGRISRPPIWLKDYVTPGKFTSNYDHSLFSKRQGSDLVIILVYVDDLLITGSSPKLVDDAKKTLQSQFRAKDFGELRYFLGIEVLRSQKGILLNKKKYALELISSVGLSGSKPVSTPLEMNQKLTIVEYDVHVGKLGDPDLKDITAYQKLIGKLLNMTITRPDISFAVQTLS
ncbi:uncharacterized protein LOC142162136 [Nicotiana tabacum]|uniref:Uncharacterized protein LOC142162136 n=1 Tax=Nicotiana tabacum TaxID=4097 RepID=A0AC58RP98_TOBAC